MGHLRMLMNLPTDKIPLNLAFAPGDHLEVMRLIRSIRSGIAKESEKSLAEVTTSEAIFTALRKYPSD